MEWINARSMGGIKKVPQQNKRDEIVSQIVGKDVSATDPRLLKFLAEKKQSLGEDVSLTEALKNVGMQQELKERLR